MEYQEIGFIMFVVTIFVAAWTLDGWSRQRRQQAVSMSASRYRLQRMEGDLFDFPGELLENRMKLVRPHFAFGGYVGDDFLLVFDAEVPSFRRAIKEVTVVARRYGNSIPPPPNIPRDMLLYQNGKWRALTTRRSFLNTRRMSNKEIEAAWDMLA